MNYDQVEQPREFKVNLYPHQLRSIFMMEKMEREKEIVYPSYSIKTSLGINADITGYGKTLSMIGLVLRNKMEWDLSKDFEIVKSYSYCNDTITKNYFYRYKKSNTTIVLTTSAIVNQWYREFLKTTMNVFKLNLKKDLDINPDDWDVIIATPSMFNLFMDKHKDKVWKRFIFDEPTVLKIPAMRPIKAGFTWFVTATPYDLLNRRRGRGYLCSITNDISHIDFLNTLIVKNDDAFVVQSFTMPPTKHLYYECYSPMHKVVSGLVDSKIASMIEAGNISGAIQALGGSESTNIADLVRKRTEDELEDIKDKIKKWINRQDEEKVKYWKEKEVQVLNKIKNLESRIQSMIRENCPICYECVRDPLLEPGCQNVFCGKCLFSWLESNNSCPMCRQHIDKSKLTYLKLEEIKEIKEDEKKIEKPHKQDLVLEIIQKSDTTSRFIIYSEFNETFEIIKETLNKAKITFIEIKGSSQTRDSKLTKFRDGKVKVAFLNSRTDSAGINMQETTDIILYHTMSEAMTQQIIGRANRIGRNQPLTVHHLIS